MPSLGNCASPCAIQNRAMGAQLTAGGDSDGAFNNALAWLDAQDITTVDWGVFAQGQFSAPTDTAPESIAYYTCPECNPDNYTEVSNLASPTPSPTPYFQPDASFAQFVLPMPCSYFVIASGQSLVQPEEGFWFAQACQADITTAPATIDIPIPDQSMDDSVLVLIYTLGILVPTSSIEGIHTNGYTIWTSSLGTLTPANSGGIIGFGSNWNPSATCAGSDGSGADPFTGADSWP